MTSAGSEMERLEQAFAVWLEFRKTPGGDVDRFLAEHADLRDLLEPLLAEADDDAEAPELPELLQPGSEFDDFRILRKIGQGGMGLVFEARQKSLDRRVALKALKPGIAATPKSVVRFKREALTAARLEHPQIVDVHAVGETAGIEWFAMEYIDGPTLDAHARDLHAADPDGYLEQILALMASVCRAIHYAHEAGVVHRDIKPANILIRPDGQPIVTDFGLSREVDLPSLTRSRDFAGTPYYIAPEQARHGSAGVDRRSDVFALGVTLYELVTQKRPFDGDSTQAVIYEILHRDPIPPQQAAQGIPADLSAVIEKALEKRPGDRYASAADLAEELERCSGRVPVRARRLGPLTRSMRWVRRDPLRQTVATILLGATLAVGGLIGYVTWYEPATQAGHRVLTIDKIESLFLDATLAPYSYPEIDGNRAGVEKKGALVAEALRLGSHEPHVVFQCVNYYMRLGRRDQRQAAAERALEILEGTPRAVQEHEALFRMRELLLRSAGRPDEAAELEPRITEPETALGHYALAALFMFEHAHALMHQDEELLEKASFHSRRAVAMMDAPRSSYLMQLKQIAIASSDKQTELIAVDALVDRWPDSAASWAHYALTYSGVDDAKAERAAARSLELRPDNFFGLSVMGQVAQARDENDIANEYFAKARRLYPRTVRFFAPR